MRNSDNEINVAAAQPHFLEIEFANGLKCVLKKPNKMVVDLAVNMSKKKELGIAGVLLANCWVSGDEAVKEHQGCLMEIQDLTDDICHSVAVACEVREDHIYFLYADGKEYTITKPNRTIVGEALAKSRRSVMGMVELVMKKCYRSGDVAIADDVSYLLPIAEFMNDILDKQTSTIKKV